MGSHKRKVKGSNSVWVQEFDTVNSTYVLVQSSGRIFFKNTCCSRLIVLFKMPLQLIKDVLSGRNHFRSGFRLDEKYFNGSNQVKVQEF